MVVLRRLIPALAACVAALVVGVGTAAAADPTLTVSFSPASPSSGSLATITVDVTPGTDPASTGLGVQCDLSWAGLGGAKDLIPQPDGHTFALQFTVPSNVLGERVGSCTVNDDQTRRVSVPYSVTISSPSADTAPNVSSHTPNGGDTGVAADADIAITFSEPVNVSGAWYAIECSTSGTHLAAVTGGPTTYTLDPSSDFAGGEDCTVTLDGSLITDQDTQDPPDALVGAPSWTFSTAAATITYAGLCADVEQVVPDKGLASSLCSKLDAAAAASKRGNDLAARNILRAFRDEVAAEDGKAIAPADAALLEALSLQL
jgi:Bacterial Ig-like domain